MIEFEPSTVNNIEANLDIRFDGDYMILNIANIKIPRKTGRELLDKLLEAEGKEEI